MPRPKGSKNKMGHKAGGKRENSGPATSLNKAATAALRDPSQRTIFGQSACKEASLRAGAELRQHENQHDQEDAASRNFQREREAAEAIWNIQRALAGDSNNDFLHGVPLHSINQRTFQSDDEDDESWHDNDDDYSVDPDDLDKSAAMNADDNHEPNPAIINKLQQNRQSSAYKESEASTLGAYIKKTKIGITSGALREEVNKGRCWFSPMHDPVSSNSVEPQEYYSSEYWVYAFLPFFQYSNICDLKQCHCIHCKAKSSLQSQTYQTRPFFDFEKIIYVLPRRFICKSCKRTFACIDPQFMSQLPSRVVERFRFIPTIGGPGMSEAMVYLLSNLVCNQVMFGTFCCMINELHQVCYSKSKLSYLDTVAELRKSSVVDIGVPPLFNEFVSPGEFGGIRLTRNLVKAVFFNFMLKHEPYMQATFQTCIDNGLTVDQSFKLSR
jgi:hypothetical protein